MCDDLLRRWLKALSARGLKLNSISAYEQSFLRFNSFLSARGIELKEAKAEHVSDFVLDRFRRGNSKITIEHHVDCIRQFFKYHRKSLHVAPSIFGVHRVRRAFDCFEKSGISKTAMRMHENFVGGRITRVNELKRVHSHMHPRG